MQSIAYIVGVFPASTFVYKEVDGLVKRGIPIKVYSIRTPHIEEISMKNHALCDDIVYMLPMNLFKILEFIKAHFYYFFKSPLKYLRIILFLMTRKYDNLSYGKFKGDRKFKSDRVRSFIHFCEGVFFAKYIKGDDISHIHAHYASHPATLAMVASILTGIPFSFTAHAYDIWLDKLFLEEKVNAAKFVITCSQYGKAEIVRNNKIDSPEKIFTVYHGVDTEKFKPGEKNSKKPQLTILTVGRLVEEKAQKNLIMACKILKEEGYEFQCQIVGDGPLFNDLQELIYRNQLHDIVNLVGKVLRENILEYYGKADIFVLPSINENLPNVLVESLAMGVPSIATNIAGISELIKNELTGILVKGNDVQELVKAIKLLMTDREFAKLLSENGRQLVCRSFDEEKCLDQLIRVYSLNGIINDRV